MKTLGYPTFWTAGILIAIVLTSLISIANQQKSRNQSSAHEIILQNRSTPMVESATIHDEAFINGDVKSAGKAFATENPIPSEASRIFLDAKGNPSVPSPSQLAETRAKQQANKVKTPVKNEPTIEKSPIKGGGEFARLDDRFRSASVATVNADGSISIAAQSRAGHIPQSFNTHNSPINILASIESHHD